MSGATVHISFVGQDDGSEHERELDGRRIKSINANLTSGVDLSKAKPLAENLGIAFMGDTKGGAFDIDAATAAHLLAQPNPDGRSNADIVRPWVNGRDLTQRPRNLWIIDFGVAMPKGEAALYEAPFEYVRNHVRSTRLVNNRESYATNWWLHVEPRSGFRRAIEPLSRYIATPRLTKHRLFTWLPATVLPDSQIIAIARDDDFTFGVLHSRTHELWARGTGTQLREVESGFRYTPTTTFETFPFPRPTDEQRERVGDAARRLVELRDGWLNPPDLTTDALEARTLTNLYNLRPTWLDQAHAALDSAVVVSYGWSSGVTDEEVLERVLALNVERRGAPGSARSESK